MVNTPAQAVKNSTLNIKILHCAFLNSFEIWLKNLKIFLTIYIFNCVHYLFYHSLKKINGLSIFYC